MSTRNTTGRKFRLRAEGGVEVAGIGKLEVLSYKGVGRVDIVVEEEFPTWARRIGYNLLEAAFRAIKETDDGFVLNWGA
jgi:hypothetical protein